MEIPQKYEQIVQKIARTAKENAFNVYIAGGFVRDLILKVEPKDLDIMVEPQNADADAKNAGINLARAISQKYNLGNPVIFEKFGTAKLIVDGEEVEFVMPRKEYYEDNSRNPQTDIGALEQDALRRDFTVNALFLDLSTLKVLDLTGKGLDDIKNKILRVTDGNSAETIFRQDPLRILRAFRFSGQLGFSIDENTLQAMKKAMRRLSIVSPERKRDEIVKILLLPKPSKIFAAMNEIGLFELIFPRITFLTDDLICHSWCKSDDDKGEKFFDGLERLLDKLPPDLFLRTAGFFRGFYTESVDDTMENLRFPDKLTERIYNTNYAMYSIAEHEGTWSDADIRKLAFEIGSECEPDFDQLEAERKSTWCDAGSKFDTPLYLLKIEQPENQDFADLAKRVEQLKAAGELFVDENFIDGNSLMEHFGLAEGYWIQKAKRAIVDALIQNPKMSRKEGFEAAAKIADEEKGRKKMRVRIRVPASTSNLGPGFDVFGAALALYNEFEVEEVSQGVIIIEGIGKDKLPTDEKNIVWKYMSEVFKDKGCKKFSLKNLRLTIKCNIPLGGGLGSSAAAIVGGIYLANALCGGKISKDEIAQKAAKIEGHPDNAVPAALGGLCICAQNLDGGYEVLRTYPKNLQIAVCLPDFEISTLKARQNLPKKYAIDDVRFNLSRASFLSAALISGRYYLLKTAAADKIHQPYRAKNIPYIDEMFAAAEKSGAYGAFISGSGPSIAAFVDPKKAKSVSKAMEKVWEGKNIKAKSFVLDFDKDGIKSIKRRSL
ncbi:MAG: homoserine kinase [Elusimicrobiota bacterium]|jgi:homoserine kinase|nr:homoserine kinase [Elusimicrobiota bacterium]